jgi:hypothetical protein
VQQRHRGFGNGVLTHYACAIDQSIDPAKLLKGQRYNGAPVSLAADIERRKNGIRRKFVGKCLPLRRAAPAQNGLATMSDNASCNSGTHAPGCPRNNDNLPIKPFVHARPPALQSD